jgi:hypothetical protein
MTLIHDRRDVGRNTGQAPQLAVTSLTQPSAVADPPPLTTLDTAGQPVVLSYQVPQPNRFSGRHYLRLIDYNLSDFATLGYEAPTAGGGGVEQLQHANDPALEAHAALGVSGATVDPRDAVVTPTGVVLGTPDAGPVVALHSYQLSGDLAALTWDQVRAVQTAGKRLVIYRSLSGQWHHRVTGTASPAQDLGLHALAQLKDQNPRRGDDPDPREPPEPSPSVTVRIASPQPGEVHGTVGSFDLAVHGSCRSVGGFGEQITVSTNGGEAVVVQPDASHQWSAQVHFTQSGSYTVTAVATAESDQGRLSATAQIKVLLFLDVQAPSPIAPSVIITVPDSAHTVIAPSGSAPVVISGEARNNGGSAVAKVRIHVDGEPPQALDTPVVDGKWSQTVVLTSVGANRVTVDAVNADNVPAPSAVTIINLSTARAIKRLSRELYLAETLMLSSYVTSVGAGRLVKVFSMLPGETATFKVSSYTKDSTTAKSAASILDSSSTEASADFENTVSDEQAAKTGNDTTTQFDIGGKISAHWGWGSAEVNSSYSNKANASREDSVKTLQSAVSKHATKAASNRSVTVNTEFTTAHEEGKSEDTTRTLTNINVGRVLNYTFREVLQECVVVVSLVDAVLVERSVDMLLEADGTPMKDANGTVLRTTDREYGLSELQDFATTNLPHDTGQFLDGIRRLLSRIVDHDSDLVSLVEWFVPTVDGAPREDQGFLRVRPRLTQTLTTESGARVAVPGIVLSAQTQSLPTGAIAVDAMLGGGNALDAYSQSLQEVTIREREASVTRELLAQQVIATKDADAAALWAKVFPAPIAAATTQQTGGS